VNDQHNALIKSSYLVLSQLQINRNVYWIEQERWANFICLS